jgi:hypothetical protein
MLFDMDKGNTRKRGHDVRRACQLLPLARSLYLSAISCKAFAAGPASRTLEAARQQQ